MRRLIAILALMLIVLLGCAQSDTATAENEDEVEKNEAIEGAKARAQEKVDQEQERVDEVNAAMDE